jgi:hypothetical protein
MTTLELFRALIIAMPVGVVSDAIVDQFLETASCRLCADAYGTKFQEASVWLAAHMLATSPGLAIPGITPALTGGSVTSLKTGDESIGFAAPSIPAGATSNDAWLATTSYGQNFMWLRDTRPASTPTVIGVC